MGYLEARARATLKATTKTNAGVLRFAQNDNFKTNDNKKERQGQQRQGQQRQGQQRHEQQQQGQQQQGQKRVLRLRRRMRTKKQRQKRRRAELTAYIPTHRDSAAMNGAPIGLGWLRRTGNGLGWLRRTGNGLGWLRRKQRFGLVEENRQLQMRTAGPSTAPLAMKLRMASLRMTLLTGSRRSFLVVNCRRLQSFLVVNCRRLQSFLVVNCRRLQSFLVVNCRRLQSFLVMNRDGSMHQKISAMPLVSRLWGT